MSWVQIDLLSYFCGDVILTMKIIIIIIFIIEEKRNKYSTFYVNAMIFTPTRKREGKRLMRWQSNVGIFFSFFFLLAGKCRELSGGVGRSIAGYALSSFPNSKTTHVAALNI